MDGIDKLGGASDPAWVKPAPVAATPATSAVQARTAEASATAQAFTLIADAAPVDMKKVEAIKSLIATGAYPIDARAVAARMLALDFPGRGDDADA